MQVYVQTYLSVEEEEIGYTTVIWFNRVDEWINRKGR